MAFAVRPLFVTATLAATLGVAGCKHSSSRDDTRIKIGLVLDKGGKDDKSFNSAAYRGAQLAEKEFGFKLKDVESQDDAAFEPALRTFAERKYPLVIAIGFAQLDAVKKVAPEFPDTHFAIVDAVADGPNVTSLVFAEHEGSFLVGAVAGLLSKTGKIGFIGGMEIPLIKRFNMGYIAGVKQVAPSDHVTTNYVGINSSAWANPSRGKELALEQYGSGVDVIFHAAGASGMGVFDAAEEKRKFVIGCDSNQNGQKPGLVATSMLKRVDNAVYDVIKRQLAGQFTAGLHQYGLKDGGIDYAVDANNEKLVAPIRARVDQLKKDIIDGKIKVPDYYDIVKVGLVILEARGLTKMFGAFTAVNDISLKFEPGQIHAIVGENGAGKSTFLKLMFGLLAPTSGSVAIDGASVSFKSSLDAIRSGLGMVQQHFTLVETLSAIDNIMLGAEVVGAGGVLKRADAIARLEKLLPSASLRVPWETPVAALTVGQRQRVEILKLLFRESRVLFLDEPTAVLAPQEIEELFAVLRALKAQGRTIVLITHKMREVMDLCDTYSVFRHGRLITRGKVADVTPSQIVEAMIGRPLPQRILDRVPARTNDVLNVTRLSERDSYVAETDSGSDAIVGGKARANTRHRAEIRGRLNDLSLTVRAGEIVGIAGVEGSGQSGFVEALMGLRDFSGSIEILGSRIEPFETAKVRSLGVGLIPEDRHHQALWMDETCKMNFVVGLENEFIRNGLLDSSAIETKSAEWSKDYDVRSSSLDVAVSALSGGNQQKLIFAREVQGRKPKLLICHQPTRGVDLAAIDLIYRKLEVLRNEGLGILVLSSELDELLDICDRMYVFFDGRVTAEFARGDFDRMKIGRAMTGETTGSMTSEATHA